MPVTVLHDREPPLQSMLCHCTSKLLTSAHLRCAATYAFLSGSLQLLQLSLATAGRMSSQIWQLP